MSSIVFRDINLKKRHKSENISNIEKTLDILNQSAGKLFEIGVTDSITSNPFILQRYRLEDEKEHSYMRKRTIFRVGYVWAPPFGHWTFGRRTFGRRAFGRRDYRATELGVNQT